MSKEVLIQLMRVEKLFLLMFRGEIIPTLVVSVVMGPTLVEISAVETPGSHCEFCRCSLEKRTRKAQSYHHHPEQPCLAASWQRSSTTGAANHAFARSVKSLVVSPVWFWKK